MDNDQKFDFASALKEIEEINKWFQEEEIDLNQGLSKFERGMKLLKECKSRLKQVENEFNVIKNEFNTEPETPEDVLPEKEEEEIPL